MFLKNLLCVKFVKVLSGCTGKQVKADIESAAGRERLCLAASLTKGVNYF